MPVPSISTIKLIPSIAGKLALAGGTLAFGSWLFSDLVLLNAVWGHHAPGPFLFWSSALVGMAVLSEMGQKIGILPGTFDAGDLLGMLGACVAGYVVINRPKLKERRELT